MPNLTLLLPEKKKFKLLYHLLFWITLILSFSFENVSLYYDLGIGNYLLLLGGRVFSIGLLIYINIQIAIPFYLRKKKYFIYFLLVVLSIALLAITTNSFNILVNSSTLPYSRNILLAYLFTGLRIAFLSYLLYIAMEWIDQKFLLKEIEIEKLHAEKQYLKNQLNPHFLFNTLNNLHGLVLTDRDRASETLLRFSDFFQYIVYKVEERRIPVLEEIQLIQDYLILEQLRISESKTIECNVVTPDSNYYIAPLILFPLVENAVKYGIQASGKNAFMKMAISIENNQLSIRTSNSKSKYVPAKTKGIGLKNLKRRLELEYPNQHSLTIQDETNTYTTHLQLTLDEV